MDERDALLSLPLSEELDFLSEFGDVLGERLNRGHFEVFLRVRAGLAAQARVSTTVGLFFSRYAGFLATMSETRFRHSSASSVNCTVPSFYGSLRCSLSLCGS